jgi:hypothetical protein
MSVPVARCGWLSRSSVTRRPGRRHVIAADLWTVPMAVDNPSHRLTNERVSEDRRYRSTRIVSSIASLRDQPLLDVLNLVPKMLSDTETAWPVPAGTPSVDRLFGHLQQLLN